MEVVILKDSAAVAKCAAQIIAETIAKKADVALGLNASASLLPIYRELINLNSAGEVSFAAARSFNSSEYVGLDPSHRESSRSFMNKHLFNHIDIASENSHVPPGHLKNPLEAGPYYERTIADAGGIDLQLLGIGVLGQLGFNEPTSSLRSRTRVKALSERVVREKSALFKNEEFQPSLAITMGLGTLLEARRVLLVATGERRAQAIADAVEGPLAARCPASALQLHENAIAMVDEAAASQLQMKEQYRYGLAFQESLINPVSETRGL